MRMANEPPVRPPPSARDRIERAMVTPAQIDADSRALAMLERRHRAAGISVRRGGPLGTPAFSARTQFWAPRR
jgi:hypothetical protein